MIRQTLDAVRIATDDAAVHEAVLREVLSEVSRMRFDESPAKMGQKIHRLIRQASGNADPYREIKRKFNLFALQLYPALVSRIEMADDSFETAVRLSIAGNIIDPGAVSNVGQDLIRQTIEEVMHQPLDRSAVSELRAAVADAGEILYIADNAGEIVFDSLLIRQMPRERVTVMVKGSPIINDATMDDAEMVGLASMVGIISSGSDAPGIILDECSPEAREKIERADLIIAKGQGNYETLSDLDKNIFFLLKAKCPVIARDIGCEIGSTVIVRRKPLPQATVGLRKGGD